MKRRASALSVLLIFALAFVVSCGGGGGGGTDDSDDPTTPTVPTGLTVTVVSATEISLSWNASTDDVGVVGYNVFRDGGVSKFVMSTSTSFTGLMAGTRYCFGVQALDGDGNMSEACSQQCVTTSTVAGFVVRKLGAQIDLKAVAWNGSQFLAAGDFSSYAFTSPDGMEWTRTGISNIDVNQMMWNGSKYVAVTDFGDVYTSPYGSSWTNRYEGSLFNSLRGLAWSGSVYVATGEGGEILTSPDATAWTQRTLSDTFTNVNDVAWGASRFVAVKADGSILTSPTGSDWTAQTSNTDSMLQGITWSGTKFCAVGLATAVTSTNGTDWTASTVAGAFLDRVAWSGTLNMFAAVDLLTSDIKTSADCVTWTNRPQPSAILYNIAWLNNQFVAVGSSGEIITSPDGVNWTTRASGADMFGVTWTGGKFIAAGRYAGRTMTSSDGVTWTYSSTGHGNTAYDIAWSSSHGTAFAVGQDSTSSAAVWSSTDGTTWTTALENLGNATNFYGVTAGNDQIVAVGAGYGGMIYTSSDGTVWSAVTTTSPMKDVAWSGSKFVAVGYNGTILSSSTGTSWTSETSNTAGNLYAVGWTGAEFVAVGISGTIVTSPDGSAWTERTSGTTNTLYSVAFDGTRIYVTGIGGHVRISTDHGVTWSALAQPVMTTLNGMAWSDTLSRLVLVGSEGTIVTRW